MKFIGIFLLTALVTWFICDGLLWLTFLLKPFTEVGKVINTWIAHGLFIVVSGWFAATLSDSRK